MNAAAVLLVVAWTSGASAPVEKVRFDSPPSAARSGAGSAIAFAISRPSDVEVAVLDRSGRVVRHLAAGVVGGDRPPTAPLGPGLAQTIVWDGADDLRRPAAGGPFRFRVRAGTRAWLQSIIGSPAVLEEKVFGLATSGRWVFVATGGGYGRNIFTIKVFDRDGRYANTIMPFSADLGRMKGRKSVAGFGEPGPRDYPLVPAQHDALLPWLYPDGLGAFMGNRVAAGALWMTDGAGHICRIGMDGACLSWGKGKAPAPPAAGPICWGIAPGGGSLYLAGWYDAARKVPDGQLFRVDPATGERTKLLSIEVPPGSFWLKEENGWYNFTNWGRKNGLSALHGVAVDGEGRILVADRVNARLAAYDSRGSLLGSTPVADPDLIALSDSGPEIYVSTRKVIDGYRAENEIGVVKLSGWKDGKVLAAISLKGRNAPCLAVHSEERPAVIWLSAVGDGKGVTRIEDLGDRLVVTGKLETDGPEMPNAVVKVWADPLSDSVIASDGWSGLARFQGPSGRRLEFPLLGIDLAFGPGGEYYVYGQKGWHELVARFDRAFKPLPFPVTGKNVTTLTTTGKDVYGRYGHGWSNKGLAVGPTGRIYVYNMYDWHKYFVNTWDRDGRAEKGSRPGDGLIGPLDPEGGGLAVDLEGNVYVGVHGFPKGFRGGRETEGSVVKFGPSGGGYAAARGARPGLEWTGSRTGKFLEGALAAYPGLAPQVSGGCVCKEARFDVDPYGRLYIPNALDYSVRIVDNAGNEVLRFGDYGNPDSRGHLEGSRVPLPDIPLGWPLAVSAGPDGRIYVADTLDHRVVRVDLFPDVEAGCPVP